MSGPPVPARLTCPVTGRVVYVAPDLVELIPGVRRRSPWWGGRVRWDCPCARFHEADVTDREWIIAAAVGARVLPAPVWVADSRSLLARVGAAFGRGVR